ncbi:M15 family metallopeptidase [Bacillus sp. EB600]|uniref:M15 family metallopeptidase n=1 Tax=Bacillus sp. EB600 TaxID=2806345 RepID=UPI002736957D|nr:M15 family metallopeptidase [Bacillus sp. EB600]MCQ6280882.1 M15 family metallopeptidase [Bacillus sp. EB600]
MKRKRKRKWNRLSFFLISLGLVTIFILFYKDPTPANDTNKNQAVPLPTDLDPVVKERSNRLIQQAAKKGIVVVITNGFRSVEEQNRLYEQGRTTQGTIVTNAQGGESYHNYGLAVDFALKTPSGNVIWDRKYDGNKNGRTDWTEVVEIAKSVGFTWGGDWAKFKDYPHLQMDFGLTIADLQNGQRPDESSLVAESH